MKDNDLSRDPAQVLNVTIAFVKNALSKEILEITAAEFFDRIKAGLYKTEIGSIRAKYLSAKEQGEDPKAAVAGLKRKLPAALPSGRFTARDAESLICASGILCTDLDGIENRIPDATGRLKTSPHILALFRSPTGTGLKAFFYVDPRNSHRDNFEAVKQHVLELTDISIDESCKDVSRLCFVSWDSDLWIRPSSSPVVPCYVECSRSSESSGCSATTACSTPLHNTPVSPNGSDSSPETVLARLKSREAAEAALQRLNPTILRLYEMLIEPRYHARVQERNIFLVNAVPFLYRAVADEVLLALVGHFYDSNSALFKDSRVDHMKEATTMLDGVKRTYQDELTPIELEIYGHLGERERAAFRIFRDLASRPESKDPAGSFFMAFEHLGARLGVKCTPAQRVLSRLIGIGIVTLLEKGNKRVKGQQPKAGKYQWLLPIKEKHLLIDRPFGRAFLPGS